MRKDRAEADLRNNARTDAHSMRRRVDVGRFRASSSRGQRRRTTSPGACPVSLAGWKPAHHLHHRNGARRQAARQGPHAGLRGLPDFRRSAPALSTGRSVRPSRVCAARSGHAPNRDIPPPAPSAELRTTRPAGVPNACLSLRCDRCRSRLAGSLRADGGSSSAPRRQASCHEMPRRQHLPRGAELSQGN